MNKLADLIEANADEIATLDSVDNGKALGIAKTVDVPHVIDFLRYCAGLAVNIKGTTVDTGDGSLCTIRKEPVGVVGAIIPWNFPAVMVAWKVRSASPCASSSTFQTRAFHSTVLALSHSVTFA